MPDRSRRGAEPFFIGWASAPRALVGFLVFVAVCSVAGFAAGAYIGAATQSDPGDGAFRWDWGRQTLTGVLSTMPYPHLHVAGSEGEDDRGIPGRTILLSGVGKRGVMARSEGLDGASVQASGIMLTRGDLLMMQVRGGEDGLAAAEETAAGNAEGAPAATPLGRWRLTGEICDGKCYAGAMRPGTGLAHKACANLCINGGTPPVFVATGPVEGASFFLMGAEDGGPLPRTINDWTATLVTLTGRIEKSGDLPVLYVDDDSIELAK